MGGWSERVMGQKGFFDVERRLEAISALGDPLETIKKIVPWEDFRTDIEAVTETKPEERKSNAGRKPYDAPAERRGLCIWPGCLCCGQGPRKVSCLGRLGCVCTLFSVPATLVTTMFGYLAMRSSEMIPT
jgi:hypothetical protein